MDDDYSSESPDPGEDDERKIHPLSMSDSDEPEVDSGTSTPKITDDPEGGIAPGAIAHTPEGSTALGVMSHQFTRFECGSEFQAVECYSTESKSLCLEDVQKSSKELWLIKAPRNFDFKGLSGQQVLLNAQQILSSNDAGNQGNRRYDVVAKKDKIAVPHILLPSRSTTKLAPGPAFQGQITIAESVSVPGITLTPTAPTKPELPLGLKQRYVPFGWEEPTIYPDSPPQSPTSTIIKDESDSTRKKKKKKKSNKGGDASMTEDQTGVHEHRKAHKRKIKTEIPDVDVPVKRKKKKKHKT